MGTPCRAENPNERALPTRIFERVGSFLLSAVLLEVLDTRFELNERASEHHPGSDEGEREHEKQDGECVCRDHLEFLSTRVLGLQRLDACRQV